MQPKDHTKQQFAYSIITIILYFMQNRYYFKKSKMYNVLATYKGMFAYISYIIHAHVGTIKFVHNVHMIYVHIKCYVVATNG